MRMAPPADVRVIMLTQEHRGLGVSTALFYLGQALVRQGVQVLLVDLSLRHSCLGTLVQRSPTKHLALWSPGVPHAQHVAGTLARARQYVAGRAGCILVDMDARLLEQAGGMQVGIDYLVLAVVNTAEARQSATSMAERLGVLEPLGHAGIVVVRVPAQEQPHLETPREGGLVVLGSLPAEYRLATAQESGPRVGPLSGPQEAYLAAVNQLASTLTRLVPMLAWHQTDEPLKRESA